MALSCCAAPFGTERVCGVTAIEIRTAGETVRVSEAATEPEVAMTLTLPVCLPETIPDELMLAIEGGALDQETVCVRSCLLPSLKKPVAVSCWLCPNATAGPTGEITIEVRVLSAEAGVVIPGGMPPHPDSVKANESIRASRTCAAAP